MELTVLGSSGSYGAPPAGTCSGYLVRHGSTNLWVDCGNGTLGNLQRHVPIGDLDGVIITHHHPDHSVDIYGLHVLWRYALQREHLPVFAPAGVHDKLDALVDGDWGTTFDWVEVGDGDKEQLGDFALRFSRTTHPANTVAVEMSAAGKRLIYTSDTCPEWGPVEFGPGADLVLAEATYQRAVAHPPHLHYTAHDAGLLARQAHAKRLMITHIWPLLDPGASVIEAEAAFQDRVTLATPHLSVLV
jgi:ribonuclease BN (tRNA processing enzyme)